MVRLLLTLIVLPTCVTLAGAAPPQANGAEAALRTVIADYEQLERIADPITAGFDGDREALRRLPDVRPQTEEKRRRDLQSIGKRLSDIDATQLSEASALNHALLSHSIALTIEESGHDFSRIAFENDSGFHTLGDYLARIDQHRIARGRRCVAGAVAGAAGLLRAEHQ